MLQDLTLGVKMGSKHLPQRFVWFIAFKSILPIRNGTERKISARYSLPSQHSMRWEEPQLANFPLYTILHSIWSHFRDVETMIMYPIQQEEIQFHGYFIDDFLTNMGITYPTKLFPTELFQS